ncbi:copia protein [Tanacetum coccineum]
MTDNDTNITGLKSHNCHIMMKRLLAHKIQQYLPPAVATLIIKLCSFFKQICSQNLMEDDMLKTQSKVVDILCNLELIYPPAFFDIMIYLVIHLPLEALKEDDHDVIHFDNSSDLALSTSLNDLDFVTLHIDGQSIDVDAPPDIIDVDEDDDIIDDEDALSYDLVDSHDEDLINVDDDDDVAMSADVARGHGGDGGGDDRPPSCQIPTGCRGHPKTQFRRQESWQAEYPLGNLEPRVKEDHGLIWPTEDPGVPDTLPFLAQHPRGAEGEGLGKD